MDIKNIIPPDDDAEEIEDKNAGVKNFLITTAIVGTAIIILAGFFAPFNVTIAIMFMMSILSVVTLFALIRYFEKPEKAKARDMEIAKARYATVESRIKGAAFTFRWGKIVFSGWVFFGSAAAIGLFIVDLVKKIKDGLLMNHIISFILGLLLLLIIIVFIVVLAIRKERILARESIRKYAYIYINILVSMMLIVR